MSAIVEKGQLADEWWFAFNPTIPADVQRELAGPGYTERVTGIFVPEDKAVEYMLKTLAWDTDLQIDFAEIFYSEANGWDKEGA